MGGDGGGNGDNEGNGAGTTTSGGGGNKTIKFVSALANYSGVQEAFSSYIDTFESNNPNVTVDFQTVGFGDFMSTVTQAAAGGSPFDVMDIPGSTNMWTLQQNDVLQPLNDVVDDLGSDYIVDTFNGEVRSPNGDMWGVPFTSTGLVNWSREDQYEEHGFEHPSGVDHQTWDQFKEVTSTVHEADNDLAGNVISMASDYFASLYPFELLVSNGGNLVDENGEVVFDSEETRQTISFVRDLFQYSPPGSANYGVGDMRSAFINSTAAHSFYSSMLLPTDIPEQNPDLKDRVNILPPPTRTESQDPKVRLGSDIFSVGKGSEHPQVARRFISSLVGDLDRMVDIYHAVPAAWVVTINPVLEERREALFEPDIYSEWEALYTKYIDITAEYGFPVAKASGTVRPETGSILGNLTFQEALQEIILNDNPIDQTVSEYATRMEEETA